MPISYFGIRTALSEKEAVGIFKKGVNNTVREGVLRSRLQSGAIQNFLTALEALNRHEDIMKYSHGHMQNGK